MATKPRIDQSRKVTGQLPRRTDRGPRNLHTVRVNVTDDDGGIGERDAATTTVVYDPNGGFATGGGWFNSEAGWFTADASKTGKANFAFVSKYKKDATAPESSVKFEFKVGNLDFQSISNEYLVVAGAKATYKGIGTLNGDEPCEFILSVVDSPDTDQESGSGTQPPEWLFTTTCHGAPGAAVPNS